MSTSGPENRFIQAVHRLLTPQVYRMKNHNPYTAGVADCWYSGNGGDLWVEYKYLIPPTRTSTVVDLCAGKNPPLSALQQEWLRSRHGEGRNIAVIIGTPRGGVWLHGEAWRMPLSSADFAAKIIPKKHIAELITAQVYVP